MVKVEPAQMLMKLSVDVCEAASPASAPSDSWPSTVEPFWTALASKVRPLLDAAALLLAARAKERSADALSNLTETILSRNPEE